MHQFKIKIQNNKSNTSLGNLSTGSNTAIKL